MGIIAIRKKMGKGLKYVFGLFLIVFAAGIFMGFRPGGGGRGPDWRQRQHLVPPGPSVIARLDGHQLNRSDFYARYRGMRGERSIRVLGDMRQTKIAILDAMTNQILVQEAAKAENVEVGEDDIRTALVADVEREIRGQFPTKKVLAQYLTGEGITIEELRESVRERYAADAGYRQRIQFQKLQQGIQGDVKLSNDQIKEKYRERRVDVILVRPEGSMLSLAFDEPATMLTDADAAAAKSRADEIVKRIRDGADFEEVAKEESAEPRSGSLGGDASYHSRDRLDQELVASYFAQQPYYRTQRASIAVYEAGRALEKPIFDGKLGEVSDPVKTAWGYVIVRVPEEKDNLPEDFEESNAQYKTLVESWVKRVLWDRYYYGKLWANAKLELEDPELKAYRALDYGDTKAAYDLLKEAVKLSRAGDEDDPGDAVQNFELALAAEALGKKDEAIAHHKAAAMTAGAAYDVHMALGTLYMDMGQKAFALSEFSAANDAALTKSRENLAVHEELESLYLQMDKEVLSNEQSVWIDEFRAEEMARWQRYQSPS